MGLFEWEFVGKILFGLLATKTAISVLRFVNTYFIRPAQDPAKFGKWSVVTGATDGIGKAIALQLAKKRQNVILISRTQSKLDDVAKQVESFGVQAQTVQVDFNDFNSEKQAEVSAAVEGKEVGILVNNVGLSYPYAMYAHELEAGYLEKLVAINCDSMIKMTNILLPQMLGRGKGVVSNVSSAASVVPQPLYAGYAGVKALVNSFTENMARDYTSKGITFQTQIPMFVVSKMSKIRRSSLTVPTPDTYAKAAVKQFGYTGTLSPYWVHELMLVTINSIPSALAEMYINSLHHNIRRRALKKLGKSK